MMLSLLIPAFNVESYIEQAIQSAMMELASNPHEIIVCDDGSTDKTFAKLEALSLQIETLRLVRHETNLGVSATRNTLLKSVNNKSNLISFFDGDDVYAEGGLRSLLLEIETNADVQMVLGRMKVVPTSALESSSVKDTDWPELHGITLSAGVYRRPLVDQVGGFNNEMTHGEDFDFLLRLGENCSARTLTDSIVFYYRRHQNNASSDIAALRRGTMHAMLLHAKRRSANPDLQDVSGLIGSIEPEVMERVSRIDA